MLKSYKCLHSNLDAWRTVHGYGLQLLPKRDLKRYRRKFPDEDGLQDKWEAAVTHSGKYVNMLVGQKDEEDLRSERDEVNYFDHEEYWDHVAKNFFVAYHQVKSHVQWCVSRPDEAEHYKRFQVRTCV